MTWFEKRRATQNQTKKRPDRAGRNGKSDKCHIVIYCENVMTVVHQTQSFEKLIFMIIVLSYMRRCGVIYALPLCERPMFAPKAGASVDAPQFISR